MWITHSLLEEESPDPGYSLENELSARVSDETIVQRFDQVRPGRLQFDDSFPVRGLLHGHVEVDLVVVGLHLGGLIGEETKELVFVGQICISPTALLLPALPASATGSAVYLTREASLGGDKIVRSLLSVLEVPVPGEGLVGGWVDGGDTVPVPDTLVAPGALAAVPLGAGGRAAEGAGGAPAAPAPRLHAHGQRGVELVARRAAALVAADRIGAPRAAARVDRLRALVPVHALVVVEVELEPWRAPALVAARRRVPAPLLAPGVRGARVEVYAECAGVVQLVATRTHALEAAISVLTRPGGRTQTL